MAKRPWGVSLMSVLSFVSAGLYIVLMVLAIFAQDTLRTVLNGLSPQGSGPAPVLLKLEPMLWIYFAIMAVVVAFLGYGLWTVRNWARVVTIVITGVSLLYGVVSLVQLGSHINLSTFLLGLLRVGLCLLVLWYLWRPNVREAFRRPVNKQNPSSLIGDEIHERG
jgi:hypothetical protein